MSYIQKVSILLKGKGCRSNYIRTFNNGNSEWIHSLSSNNYQARTHANVKTRTLIKTRSRTLATNHYGTPRTGLILPKKNSKENEDSRTNTVEGTIPSTTATTNTIISPLLNVNQSNLHGFSRAKTTQNALEINESNHVESSLMTTNKPSSILGNDNTSIDKDTEVALDIGSMYDPQIHLPHKPDFNDPRNGYETATPLGDELMRYIGASGRGGISVAEYMGRCLRDERFGYYTNPPSGDDINDCDDFKDDDSFEDDDDIELDNKKDSGIMENTTQEMKGRGDKIIGAAGDFTTAPEISQIFGECITVWLLAQYEIIGKPSRVQLVEIGPGRGTLMCDILRSARSIKGVGEEFIAALSNRECPEDVVGSKNSSAAVNGVHLVEVSENLRLSQFEALEALGLQITNDSSNGSTDCDTDDKEKKELFFNLVKWNTKEEDQEEMEAIIQKLRNSLDYQDKADPRPFPNIAMEKELEEQRQLSSKQRDGFVVHNGSVPVHWHNSLNSIPSLSTVPTFIIGQEILDALPVHVFQKTDDGWKERLVDIAIQENKNDTHRQVPSKDPHDSKTTSSTTMCDISNDSTKKPRFRYVLSSGTTPALRSLLHVDDKGNSLTVTSNDGSTNQVDSASAGTVLEVCPEALLLVQDITSRIESCNGAALLIDYGNEGSGDTLRAFRRHRQVDVLSGPGTVDITADVDFSALKDAVNIGMTKIRNNDVGKKDDNGECIGDEDDSYIPIAFGPVTQGQFLASMGAVERTLNLIEDENTSDDQAEDLCKALERLLSEKEMGERYKVMAIARKKDGIFPPPGF